MDSTRLSRLHDRRSVIVGAGLAACAAVLAATSCDWSGKSAEPAAPGDLGPVASQMHDNVGLQDEFFPLAIGNRWHVDASYRYEFFPTGSDVSDGAEVFHSEQEWVLDQTEELFGRTYVVQSQTIVQDLPEPEVSHAWIRMRQDRAGLYEADVSINDPPGDGAKAAGALRPSPESPARGFDLAAFGPRAAAHETALRDAITALERRRMQVRGALRGQHVAAPPGGVVSDELTRLSYPLHPGARWDIRDGLLEARVERQEVVVTPAGRFTAWRIRLVWSFADFDDTILVWFGRCGMLKLYFQGQSTLTDESGQVLGTIQAEETDIVEDLDIQGRPCGSRSAQPVLTE